ncbi:winged helix-turn-helix transcriptional regulator [Gordonia sp. LSe1-13]|uniref:Winged helix-turn-helix transcriptional regulator n=1 Tax=Gordonia sesuvii TaxID=3116777 RepID=A0ABU7MA77_9ACTN|nr:winged helix-turn-helix transcriptional regulator [Gordonia sp. LSe1-13]
MRDLDVDSWAARFAVLSDATRLRLVIDIHQHPRSSVADLAQRAEITENAASQSLRALRDLGWVHAEKCGRTVLYEVVHDAIVHRILHDIVGVAHADGTHPVTAD